MGWWASVQNVEWRMDGWWMECIHLWPWLKTMTTGVAKKILRHGYALDISFIGLQYYWRLIYLWDLISIISWRKSLFSEVTGNTNSIQMISLNEISYFDNIIFFRVFLFVVSSLVKKQAIPRWKRFFTEVTWNTYSFQMIGLNVSSYVCRAVLLATHFAN